MGSFLQLQIIGDANINNHHHHHHHDHDHRHRHPPHHRHHSSYHWKVREDKKSVEPYHHHFFGPLFLHCPLRFPSMMRILILILDLSPQLQYQLPICFNHFIPHLLSQEPCRGIRPLQFLVQSFPWRVIIWMEFSKQNNSSRLREWGGAGAFIWKSASH